MIRFILTLFLVVIFTPHAHAELRIDLTKGVVEPMPIAVTPFFYGDDSSESFGGKMAGVISANLEGSGLFKPVAREAFLQSSENIAGQGVRFGDWRSSGTQALVTGRLTPAGDGRTRVEFRLWDVFSEKQIAGMAYTTAPQNWRRIAHIISDEIYKRLSGEDGYFDSRIVYVAESGPMQRRIKRLAIMDQDGFNHKYLTDGKNLVLTPRFSPTEQKITYMSYGRGGPQVYLYDISTGAHDKLGNFPGMTFAPRFSPDGKSVVMSLATNGNTEIYKMDIATQRKVRLTNSAGIDTAPSFSPNGRQIVFESDRGGAQQLYTMNADGSNVQRISFGSGNYGSPVWSPRGDLIAFTKISRGKFYIGVMRPDGSGERLITNAYHVEGPTWSPNGRVLSYFKERVSGPRGETRQSKIYTVDITGFNETWLRTPKDGSDPAWSPLNK